MELRVLHMAAHGTTWYGRWGYAFGRGGFNIQAPAWRAAAAAVAAAPLAALRADFAATGADADALRVLERYEVRRGGSARCKPLQGAADAAHPCILALPGVLAGQQRRVQGGLTCQPCR